MTEEEKKIITTLQESAAANNVRMDRILEKNAQYEAKDILVESLRKSNLQARSQDRIRQLVLVNVPLTADKALDVTKFQESVKTAIQDETTYLQECGLKVGPQIVRHLGGTGIELLDEAGKEKDGEKILQEADKLTGSSIDSILGRKEKTA